VPFVGRRLVVKRGEEGEGGAGGRGRSEGAVGAAEICILRGGGGGEWGNSIARVCIATAGGGVQIHLPPPLRPFSVWPWRTRVTHCGTVSGIGRRARVGFPRLFFWFFSSSGLVWPCLFPQHATRNSVPCGTVCQLRRHVVWREFDSGRPNSRPTAPSQVMASRSGRPAAGRGGGPTVDPVEWAKRMAAAKERAAQIRASRSGGGMSSGPDEYGPGPADTGRGMTRGSSFSSATGGGAGPTRSTVASRGDEYGGPPATTAPAYEHYASPHPIGGPPPYGAPVDPHGSGSGGGYGYGSDRAPQVSRGYGGTSALPPHGGPAPYAPAPGGGSRPGYRGMVTFDESPAAPQSTPYGAPSAYGPPGGSMGGRPGPPPAASDAYGRAGFGHTTHYGGTGAVPMPPPGPYGHPGMGGPGGPGSEHGAAPSQAEADTAFYSLLRSDDDPRRAGRGGGGASGSSSAVAGRRKKPEWNSDTTGSMGEPGSVAGDSIGASVGVGEDPGAGLSGTAARLARIRAEARTTAPAGPADRSRGGSVDATPAASGPSAPRTTPIAGRRAAGPPAPAPAPAPSASWDDMPVGRSSGGGGIGGGVGFDGGGMHTPADAPPVVAPKFASAGARARVAGRGIAPEEPWGSGRDTSSGHDYADSDGGFGGGYGGAPPAGPPPASAGGLSLLKNKMRAGSSRTGSRVASAGGSRPPASSAYDSEGGRGWGDEGAVDAYAAPVGSGAHSGGGRPHGVPSRGGPTTGYGHSSGYATPPAEMAPSGRPGRGMHAAPHAASPPRASPEARDDYYGAGGGGKEEDFDEDRPLHGGGGGSGGMAALPPEAIEEEGGDMELIECPTCGRKFNEKALAKHAVRGRPV